jgi:uncharacterized damage-inducible protein DinB
MKNNLIDLIRSLKDAPKIISDYISMIPEKELNIKRGGDFWSIKEHLVHLDFVQDLLFERILKFNNEENPKIIPYFPKDEKNLLDIFNSIDEILNSYKNKRDKQIELIDQLKETDFEKEGTHDEYKKYNLEIILNHILFHDYWHMYRIEELWLTKDKYL